MALMHEQVFANQIVAVWKSCSEPSLCFAFMQRSLPLDSQALTFKEGLSCRVLTDLHAQEA